jgi:KDO2-lipid IV(A) lauroyltransferase
MFFRQLGGLIFYLSKKRKSIVLQNLNLCFGHSMSLKTQKKIALMCFKSLGHAVADFLLLKKYTQKRAFRYVNVKNIEKLNQILNEGRGAMLCSGHFGSWELAAQVLALRGIQSLILYNPIRKPLWLENWVKRRREFFGNKLIAKKSAFWKICCHLKKGGVAVLVVDQNCKPIDGIRVPLFGRNVWTNVSFVKLSLKLGTPIVPGFMFIKGLNGYELRLGDPLRPEKFMHEEDPVLAMSIAFHNELEASIKEAPEQWLWQHRRFKNL